MRIKISMFDFFDKIKFVTLLTIQSVQQYNFLLSLIFTLLTLLYILIYIFKSQEKKADEFSLIHTCQNLRNAERRDQKHSLPM